MATSRHAGLQVQPLALVLLSLFVLVLVLHPLGVDRPPAPPAVTAAAPTRDAQLERYAAIHSWSLPLRMIAYTGERQPQAGRPETADPPVLSVEPLVPRPERREPTHSAPLPPYGLAIPVEGVGRVDLVDSFLEPRGRGRQHLAIDIAAPTGTPVVAATGGTVLRLHASANGGLTVYLLDEEERYVYYYAHLSGYAEGLHAGQRVEQGQKVGYVGYTGNAHESHPHLHFAIWKQRPGGRGWGGRPVNPYLALKH